jgi:hypothetical protein
MKRMTIKTILALLLLVQASQAQLKSNLNFTVTYPDSPAGITFLVYGTTNLSQPINNWPLMYTAVTTNFVRPFVPGPPYFFATKTSNEVGISDFSTVAPVLSAPRSDAQLAVKPQ